MRGLLRPQCSRTAPGFYQAPRRMLPRHHAYSLVGPGLEGGSHKEGRVQTRCLLMAWS